MYSRFRFAIRVHCNYLPSTWYIYVLFILFFSFFLLKEHVRPWPAVLRVCGSFRSVSTRALLPSGDGRGRSRGQNKNQST